MSENDTLVNEVKIPRTFEELNLPILLRPAFFHVTELDVSLVGQPKLQKFVQK